MPRSACWTRENANDVLRIEALEHDEALFLATHSGIEGFGIAGSRAADILEASEEGLLQALSAPDRTHAFCVIQGAPGAGKSHLIRWLDINWPRGRDVVLLLQRADGSLDGALNQLRAKLGSEFEEQLARIGARQTASLTGQAADLLSSLANRMDPEYYEGEAPKNGAWALKHDVEALLKTAGRWAAPRQILELINGAGGARNSETAGFGLEDIHDLVKLRITATSPQSGALYRGLTHEMAEVVVPALAEGRRYDQIELELADRLPASTKLIDALNARLNDAVQRIIGVTAADLKRLFETVRERLKARGSRLVLLLEDITSLQGLDNGLLEALITNADTRQDLCPVISVVGVTPKYYRQLEDNYYDRISHEVVLGEGGDGQREVAGLREGGARHRFVARYLNAARLGRGRLHGWREDFRLNHQRRPPNPCLDCPQLVACHRDFGEVEGIGLFPFTPRAIDNFYHLLRTDDRGQTHRTPRGLLQNVLAPSLLNEDRLALGAYPGPEIEIRALRSEEIVLPGALQALLRGRSDEPAHRDQLRRLLAVWGDKTRGVTVLDQAGQKRFADVPEGVFAAFDLPWVGGEPGVEKPRPPAPEPKPRPQTETEATPDPKPRPVRPEGRETVSPPAGPKRPTDAGLQILRREIPQARADDQIASPARWNERVAEFVGMLKGPRLGADAWLCDRLFTSERIKIATTGQIDGRTFEIPREPILYDGLEAFVELRLDDPDEETADFYRRRLALFMGWLEGLARRHVAAKAARLPDGGDWDVVVTLTQVLLARAWLRGDASPLDPPEVQWQAVLSDPRPSEGDLTVRHKAWRDCLTATNPKAQIFRDMLRRIVDLPQGTSTDAGMVAGAAGAHAILALAAQRLRPLPAPTEKPRHSFADIDNLIEVAATLADNLPAAPSEELRQLRLRAGELDAILNGHGLQARAGAIDAAIAEFALAAPNIAMDAQREWHEARRGAAGLLQSDADSRALETLMIEATDEDILSRPPTALLDWLARAPAGQLKTARDLFVATGQKTIEALYAHAETRLNQASGGADLSGLRTAGQTLLTAADEADAAIKAVRS